MRKESITGGGNGGFTLIEMLIVIAVISILAGVVITGVSGFQAGARDTKRIADMKNTQSLLELYYNKVGLYPDATTWGSLTDAMTTAGIDRVPQPQVAAYDYFYGETNQLQYTIGAALENDNAALDNDIDGDSNGVSCGSGEGELIYCTN